MEKGRKEGRKEERRKGRKEGRRKKKKKEKFQSPAMISLFKVMYRTTKSPTTTSLESLMRLFGS